MRKKDEMEQKIANKAVKITWFITVMAMFVLGIILNYLNKGEGSLLLLLAILSTTFLISLEQFYLSKINENQMFKKMIGAAIILTVILLGLAWFLSQ